MFERRRQREEEEADQQQQAALQGYLDRRNAMNTPSIYPRQQQHAEFGIDPALSLPPREPIQDISNKDQLEVHIPESCPMANPIRPKTVSKKKERHTTKKGKSLAGAFSNVNSTGGSEQRGRVMGVDDGGKVDDENGLVVEKNICQVKVSHVTGQCVRIPSHVDSEPEPLLGRRSRLLPLDANSKRVQQPWLTAIQSAKALAALERTSGR